MDSIDGVHYITDHYAVINTFLREHFEREIALDLIQDAHITIAVDTENRIQGIDITLREQDASKPSPDNPESHPGFFTIGPESDLRTIRRAFKHARALFHPDRVASLSGSFKEAAERNRDKIEKSASILLNDEIRPLYNERLAAFYEKDPRLVSQSGAQIIPLDGETEFFSLDNLLGDKEPDMSALEQGIKQHTQFSEEAFQRTKALFETMPGNEQIRAMYKEALTAKLTYLSLLEDAGWAKIGYLQKGDTGSRRLMSADAYAEHVETELKRIKAGEVPLAVAQRNDALRIGTAQAPLLLTDQREGKSAGGLQVMDEDTMQKVITRAAENLEARATYLRDIAAQKQALLEELVTFCDLQPITERDLDNPVHVILLATNNKNGEAIFMIAYELDVSTTKMKGLENGHKYGGKPLDTVLEGINLPTTNAFILVRNPEIDSIHMEVMAAGEKLLGEWEKHHPPAPAEPEGAAPA